MQIVTEGKMPVIPEQVGSEVSPAELGIAVDIGTTTIAVSTWSLLHRKHLLTIAEKNNQVRYGYDIIRRIAFAVRPPLTGSSEVVESGPSALHYCIISQLEKMFAKAVYESANLLPRGFQPKVTSIVITGNTTMLSFLCSVPVNNMAAAPFTPATLFDKTTTWKKIRDGKVFSNSTALDKPTPELLQIFNSSTIDKDTDVYIPPCIGAFIGADAVCAMVAAGFPVPNTKNEPSTLRPWESKVTAPLLLADIGTNSELCLYIPDSESKKGRILCTSAASGPAFEGANISCGMPSIDGAIDKITYKNDKLNCHTIGDKKPRGLCGTGLISAAAVMLKNKYIDKNGMITREKSKLGDGTSCIELTPAVYLSQQDIRNLQLAKSAVKTGLEFLLEHTEETPVFCIAGGFGSKINFEEATAIGLLPPQLEKRTIHLGNAALSGASALLFSNVLREKAKALAKKSVQINLAGIPEFQERFLKGIDF
ncbi:ASKHA domain-containing protein [uncultured Treponema sp.]|uniref:ASKHA domain-containing protein n=1 Tax=uncultured Treponema sp. TaxID=162155 RepID=UPI0025D89135|nr:ASKHA domain-containing protein [uncultured Treponema sp.]